MGKLSDKRYTMLYNQYGGEKEQLQDEVNSYKKEQAQYEYDRKSTARFLKLVERYSNAEKMPTPEELEEMRKKEARKDKLHQNYLKRKANGRQKDIHFHAGVLDIPRAGQTPQDAKQAVM